MQWWNRIPQGMQISATWVLQENQALRGASCGYWFSREPLFQDTLRLTLSASLNLPDLAVASKKWPFFPQRYQSHAWVPSGIGLVCYFLASFIHQAPLLNAPETEATGRREVNVPSKGSQKQGWTSRKSMIFKHFFNFTFSLSKTLPSNQKSVSYKIVLVSKTELPYDPAVPLLGIYPKELKTGT